MGRKKREKQKLKNKKSSLEARRLQIPSEKPKKSNYVNLDNQIILLNSEYGHIYAYLEAVHGFLCLPDSAVDSSYKEKCKEIMLVLDEAFKILDPRFREARGLYNFLHGKTQNKKWPEKLKILEKNCKQKGLDGIKEDLINLREIVIKVFRVFPIKDIQNTRRPKVNNEQFCHYQILLYSCNYMLEQEIDRYRRNPAKYGLDPLIFENVS